MFFSLAEALEAHAVGIIRSGYEGDGTAGCQPSTAKGGELIETALTPGDYPGCPGAQILKSRTAQG
jgi:chemotaxis response regulator CheB